MGFIEDKNNIVQQISLTEVLGDLPENKLVSNIESVKSKSRNLAPFLLDLLSIACKDQKTNPRLKDRVKCDLIRILSEILVEFFPILMRILKEGLIKGIKAGLLCPSDFKIPTPLPFVDLKPNEFDSSGLTTMEPDSFPASLFFGEPDNDLNVFLADLMQGGVGNTGIWKDLLDFEVIDYTLPTLATTNGLKVTINSSYAGIEYDVFLKDFINSIELFNFDNFIPNLMEELNGTISSMLKNSSASISGNFSLDLEAALTKEKVNALIDKILEKDPCEENFILDDSFFEFDSDELLDLEKNAQNRFNGVKPINYSCGPTGVGVINIQNVNLPPPPAGVNLSKNNNAQAKLNTQQTLDSVLQRSTDLIAGDIKAPQDQTDAIKKSFSFELALALPKLTTSIIFSPKIMVLFQVSKKLVTNTVSDILNNFDFAKANSVFFEYVVREASAAFLKILYDQIKEEILKIVQELIKTLVKEAIDKKLAQIKSLTGKFDISAGISAITDKVDDLTNELSS